MLYVLIAAAAVVLASAGCYNDDDCGNNQYCNNGECENEETICYGDDECRGRMVCDMYSYICVEPTPSPVTTSPPGCCYSGDSYKANDRCAKATDRARCEDMGCSFLETDDPSDCEMTTTETPTTTEEVGCCKGDSLKTNPMCNARTSRAQCERSSSCHFIVNGIVDEECLIEPPSSTTLEPGCCYGNPDTAYSKRWMDQCKSYYTERECLMLEDEDGNKRCTFEPMNEYT